MFYPIMIDLKNKKALVVGGGKVAYRKCKKLLECDCSVTVVSRDFDEKFDDIKDNITTIKDTYKNEYLKDYFLVIASTSSKKVNEDVFNDCQKKNIICNVVDDIELSTFILPSSLKKGSLVISISTMGKSPSLSAKIKKDLEKQYEGYDEKVDLLGQIRKLVLEKCNDPKKKKDILNEIVYLNVSELEKRRQVYENSSWF